MEYTKNLRLSKPSYDDDVDIQVLNNNMDMLDEKVGNLQYLPLAGGTMKGDIKLPYEIGIRYDPTTCIKFITQDNKKTVRLEGEQLSFNTPTQGDGTTLYADDDGVWYKNKSLIRDLGTDLGWHSGHAITSTGMLIQWGYVNPQGGLYNVQHATLSRPFATPQYAVVTSRSFGVDNKSNNFEGRWGSATFNLTTTGFDIVCAEPNAYGHTEFWIAIGKGV